MSVNLSRAYRVIVIVIVVGMAFSALAWSGGNRLQPRPGPDRDTIPSHRNKQVRKGTKPRYKKEEGRAARELDLRIDAEEPEAQFEMDLSGDMDIPLDLEGLKGLNARIEADVLKNADLWKPLDEIKDLDALEELECVGINEDDLLQLKDLNIDEEIWNELRDLKLKMDDLKEELDGDLSGKMDDYRLRESRQWQ